MSYLFAKTHFLYTVRADGCAAEDNTHMRYQCRRHHIAQTSNFYVRQIKTGKLVRGIRSALIITGAYHSGSSEYAQSAGCQCDFDDPTTHVVAH